MPFVNLYRGRGNESAGVPFFHRMAGWDGVDLFVQAPGGQIQEVQVHTLSNSTAGLPYKTWSLCEPREL